MLAERPVVVGDGHADRGVGIHHLFGRDDFQLVRIGVEAELLRHAADFLVDLLDQFERPFRLLGQGVRVAQAHERFARGVAGAVKGCTHHFTCFLNSSRNTG